MIIPVRCFSCNKIIGNLGESYNNLRAKNTKSEEIYEKLGITRICCKRMLMTYCNLSDDVNKYDTYNNPKITITKNNDEKKILRGI